LHVGARHFSQTQVNSAEWPSQDTEALWPSSQET
jgi:hypothetical protein